ncbi:MAG TPA: chromate transporter [Planctomycetaceae bacterium]|nr:chromate transporter [Planctomycetaceae bacterium]
MTSHFEAKPSGAPGPVSFSAAFRVWMEIAALSFGGPTGQIAVMHRLLVDRHRWISDRRFLHALNYCMLLPGPEAHQLVTYTGWLLHGVRGGLTAGLLFILPGALALLVLSALYVEFQQTPLLQGLFYGLKAAVLAVVVEAVIRIGRRVLKNPAMYLLAALAFVAIRQFGVPFPAIIVAAALAGFVGGLVNERLFLVVAPRQSAADAAREAEYLLSTHTPPSGRNPTLGSSLATSVVWLLIWWLPVGLCWLLWGQESILVSEGVFFSKTALLTFGGAYAVLPYVAQQAVESHRWLSTGEMMDGLGLAESTPGPLIIVLQFVGFLAAYRQPGTLSPWTAALLGSAITTWVTFAPSFLFIFVGAPWIERWRDNRRLSMALSGVTAAVVGVILNLAVWFAVQTLLHSGPTELPGWPRTSLGELGTLDWVALGIAVGAGVALLRYHVALGWVLSAAALAGWMGWKAFSEMPGGMSIPL